MRTTEEWQRLIDEQMESGLNQKEFCLSKGLSLKTFSTRKSRMRSAARIKFQPKKAKFIRVQKRMSNTSFDRAPVEHLRLKTRAGIEIEFSISALGSVLSLLNGDAR
jgi:hypothetical protein